MVRRQQFRGQLNPSWRRRILATTIAQALAFGAQAATINVNNAGDVSGPAHCTLRDAVKASNNDAGAGGCVAGAGDDLITIDASLSGETITLSSGQLTLKSHVTIQGQGPDDSVISGGGSSRIFAVKPYVNVTISQVTLEQGYATSGGAIDNNSGNVTIEDSVVSNNSASGSGGAIYNYYGQVQIHRSTLTGNSAGSRGGVLYAYYDQISVTDSTVSGNMAERGGALFGYAFFTVEGSTFANNSATDGAADLHTSGELSITNTILADSQAGANCSHPGIFLNNANNVVEDGSCATGGVNLHVGDPLLGPLTGPGRMLIHPLLAGSNAVDGGALTACSGFDQMGMPRPIDGNGDTVQACDIGAFEFVDLVGPSASLGAAGDVSQPGGLSHAIPVMLADDVMVDANSLDDSDIQVTGPNGFAAFATLTNRVPLGDASVINSEYQLIPPGGSWDVSDNGTYVVALQDNEVFDLGDPDANAAAGAVLGSFEVVITDIQLAGNDTEISNNDVTPAVVDGTQFGTVLVGNTRSRLFRVTNAGAGTLNLTGPVAVSDPTFEVTMQPAVSQLQAGESTLFEVTYTPGSAATTRASVSVPNDDFIDGTFSFDVEGAGTLIATAPVAQDMNVNMTDAAPRDAIVAQVAASDAEDNIRSQGGYAIVAGDAQGAFWIDDEGQLRVANETLLDQSYTLTVSVTDETDLADTATVVLRVVQGDLLFRSPME